MSEKESKRYSNGDPENKEKEVMEQIRCEAEKDPVPEKLKPEKIEQMLRKRRKINYYAMAKKYVPAIAAAACICVVAGIGAVMGPGADTSEETKQSSTASSDADRLVSAQDYDQIYDYLQNSPAAAGTGAAMNRESSAAYGTQESAAASDSSGAAYSDTNIRETGVEEGDVVKTDGENLFILNNMTVEIVGTDSGKMEEKAQIVLDEEAYIAEIYVRDDRLLAVYTKSVANDDSDAYSGAYRDNTYSVVYDVSDPSAPEQIGSISQSGSYNTMRISGGYVYVLSSYYANPAVPRTGIRSYVPEVQGEIMPASDIYMPQGTFGSRYTVITAFSLSDPTEKTDSRAVFGNAGICYVSGDGIYVTEEYYDAEQADTNETSIRKIFYKDGMLEGVAQTKIDGALKDSFCIDEYNGSLRLVTTVTSLMAAEEKNADNAVQTDEAVSNVTDSNTLYILDQNLQEISRIENIARDERVYSARFMGNIGYFVTFRQTDPLFSVDLSDPENPEIIGELKIPGFSEYLHPYGDGYLLGIGMATDEEGVTTTGIKLSMFDISDPTDVRETGSFVLEDMYSTDVAYNYKAAFIDAGRNLFGFLAYGEKQTYYIFSYDEANGFQQIFARDMSNNGARGLYIGNSFYLVAGNTVESFGMNGYEKIDDIVL